MQRKSAFMYACLLCCAFFTLAQALTLTVTTTADSGPGSLRQALTDVNTSPAADTIIFNIPQTDAGFDAATGVWTILPATDLPALENDSTVIDATTQTAGQGDLNSYGPEVVLCGRDSLMYGFQINSSYNKVKGLVINRFTNSGIIVNSSANHNIICGNYIGADAAGASAAGCDCGIRLYDNCRHNIIGGDKEQDRNLISGNDWGILIFSHSDSNIVIGNYIGIDAAGYSELGNYYCGIYINTYSHGNRIGGLIAGERNIISGSIESGNIVMGNGITVERSDNNYIIGNFIGTNCGGLAPIANTDYGIALIESSNNIIGGLEPGAANVISGNDWGGIFIRFPESQNNVITGNFICTDLTATLKLGNKGKGVYLDYGAQKKYNRAAKYYC